MQNTTNFNNFAVWADGSEEKLQTANDIFKGSFSNGDYLITAEQNAFFNQLSLVTVSLAHAISAPAWANNLSFDTYKTSFKSAFENAINAKMQADGTSAFAKVVGNATANYNYDQLKAKADLLDAMKASFYVFTTNVTFSGGTSMVLTDNVADVATRTANGYTNAIVELVVDDTIVSTYGLYVASTDVDPNNYNGKITIKGVNGLPSSGTYTLKFRISDYSFRG